MHNIHHETYDEKVNKKKVQAYWDNYAAREDYQEGCSGLGQPIRWIDYVCDDINAAYEYIEQHDRGWYDQLAVKFRKVNKEALTTATYTKLVDRLREEEAKLESYTKQHSTKTFKSQFIGCGNCGSKLNREFLRTEKCPLCGTDLRGKTTLDTIERYKTNIKELQKKIREEEKKIAQKATKNSKIYWLVKIEFHT